VKIQLMEIAHLFRVPTGDTGAWIQVIVRSSLLRGKLDLTFTVGNEARELLPATVVDGIQQAVEYAGQHAPAGDLSEMDPEERESE
jgi:hypothetical protein